MSQPPTNSPRFNNPSSQAERERLIQEEKLMNTRQALHSVIEPAAGGRFATTLREEINPVHYPRQPSSSPWSQEGAGVEPPLGFSVEDMEAVGTEEEIARSIAAAASLGGSTDADLSNGSATAAGLPSPPSGDPPPFSSLAGSSTVPGNSASSPFDAAEAPVATRSLSKSWRRY
jgi:hypothetical protein